MLETSECQYEGIFHPQSSRQTWPKNCRLNFPHPPWAKKRTQPQQVNHQWQNVKETLKACCSRSPTWFIKTKPLWQGWKIMSRQMCNSKSDLLAGKSILTTNHPTQKKLTRLKLGLFHSKAAKLPSSSRALFVRSSRGRTPNATITQWNPSCSSVNGQPVCSSYRNSAVAFPPQVPENTHFCFTQHEGKL